MLHDVAWSSTTDICSRKDPVKWGSWGLLAAALALSCAPLRAEDAPRTAATGPGSNNVKQTAGEEGEEHPLDRALQLAEKSRDTLSTVNDYTANFIKMEMVKNKPISQSMQLKFREKPFSVYLHFQDAHKGREVLYVEGANAGKLLVREAGLKSVAGTFSFTPLSPEVMNESRYPITNIGMKKLLDAVIEQWKSETAFGETNVEYFPNAKIGETACLVISSTHPQMRKQFPFHKTLLWIDKQSNLPIRVTQHGWPAQPGQKPPVVEEYTYLNLKTNVGLNERDFDRKNPSYRFGK